MKKIAFMFPGQGSQTIGMGKELHDKYPDVRELYGDANGALARNLRSLIFEGYKEELTATENAQPALLLNSMSIHKVLEKEGVTAEMAVGHSLGEYSALVASGVLDFEEAIKLVETRGKLMEEAFPKGQGTMAAVLGLGEPEIQETLDMANDEVIDLANINCPGQIVISGTVNGIEKVTPLLKEKGAKRVLPLNVSGPFHSRLMKAANNAFEEHLNNVAFSEAQIPVYANVTAEPVSDPEAVKDLLLQQLYSPVRFEESIRNMAEKDIDAFVEVGNGKVLSGLVRKIDRNIKTFAVHDQETIDTFLEWYREDV